MFSDSGGGDPDDGGQQAQDGVTEYHGNIGKVSSRERLGDHQCRYHGGYIGVEQIGAHTGHVTHVVAYIVGDYGRIAGVIFGNPQLHLSGEIRGDIRRFGEDSSAGLCEQSQGAGSEGKAQKDGRIVKKHQNGRYSQQRAADHQQPHHGTAPKSDQEGRLDALPGGFRRTSVG